MIAVSVAKIAVVQISFAFAVGGEVRGAVIVAAAAGGQGALTRRRGIGPGRTEQQINKR